MNPLTASAFDLPERLSAKADPALIDGDERQFAAIAESLEQSIAELSGRLEAERKAPGGIGQEAMDRDMEVYRLAARLRTLRRFGLDLCLGRIVPADDPGPVYVGRLGLTDSAGRRLLLDWRSPAAEPFFGATHASPMGLASRAGIGGPRAGSATTGTRCSARRDGGPRRARRPVGVHREPGRQPVRADADVLGTIQADQDAIIRAGSRGALVVDGGPGTGKTVVALHRAAYLLYSDPASVTAGAACCSSGRTRPTWPTSPTCSPASARRACRLPPCGTSSPREPRGGRDRPGVAREVVGGPVTAIEPAVRFYERPPPEGMTVRPPGPTSG